tara:strand:- start:337 stop:1539 length:1203 start_codon:yes stop_codon:yes gene_type:complete
MIDIYSALDYSKVEQGWKPTTQKVNERKPSDLCIGDWSVKCRKWFPNLRYNELTKFCESNNKKIKPSSVEQLYIVLGEMGWKIDKAKAQDVFEKVAQENSYNPIKEYLEYLEKDQTIVPADISKLSTTYLKTTDPLSDEMLFKWLVGAAQRIFENGCQMDFCLVLKGKQGLRKSTFFRTLCKGFFCDSMAEGKDHSMLIGTTWFKAFEELETITGKKECGELKNLITIREDIFRAPFARNTDHHPRASVFCATVNDDQFLKDQTGNRRFWVIEVKERIDKKQVENDLDSIWKGIMLAYRKGILPMLSEKCEDLSNLRNSQFEQEDPYEYYAFQYLKNTSTPWRFTAREVLCHDMFYKDPEKIKRTDLTAMGKSLARIGCTRAGQSNKKGDRSRYWTNPEK